MKASTSDSETAITSSLVDGRAARAHPRLRRGRLANVRHVTGHLPGRAERVVQARGGSRRTISALRTEAKLTHARYGANSTAAAGRMRPNSTIVARIADHS